MSYVKKEANKTRGFNRGYDFCVTDLFTKKMKKKRN